MDFELQAQYENYTRAELIHILDHADGYTPEAVAVATAILDARHPGWDAAKAQEALLAQEERHATQGPDLLDDLEEEVMPTDRVSKTGYWMVLVYLLICNANLVRFIIRMLFFTDPSYFANVSAFQAMQWPAGMLVLLGAVTVLWYRKSRWGWNLAYGYLLYEFTWYTARLLKTSVWFPPLSYPVTFAAMLLAYGMALTTPVCLWLAARKRTADLFNVVLANRVFIVVVGWVLALSYLCLTWGDDLA